MPLQAEQKALLKKTKYKSNRDFLKIGFVFKDLSARQEYIYFTPAANQIVQNTPSISISCFFIENYKPIVDFHGASYHVSDAWFMESNLVATSIETLFSIKNCSSSDIILYFNDIEYERQQFKYTLEQLKEILKLPKYIVFRSIDHYNKLVQDNIIQEIENPYVCDVLDVNFFLELVTNDKV